MAIPLGLQQLMALDELTVTEMKNYSSENKYTFMAPNRSTMVLHAREEPNRLGDLLAGRSRDLRFQVFDSQQQLVFTIDRDYSMGPSKMEIGFGGQLASIVRRKCTCLRNNYTINDAYDQPVLKVKGPIAVYGSRRFVLLTSSGAEVGAVWRRGPGARARLDEYYNLKFPLDLDVRIKAAVVGLTILIDVMIYEGRCF